MWEALNDSRLLSPKSSKCTVWLDPAFSGANGTSCANRTAVGVCESCSPSHRVNDADGIVPKRHDDDGPDADSGSQNSQELAVPRERVAIYSDRNSMSINLFHFEHFRNFSRTWMSAERMLLRPVHLCVTVLRSRSSNVPFTNFGSISYPLQHFHQAEYLLLYDFKHLPFCVSPRREGRRLPGCHGQHGDDHTCKAVDGN